MKADTWTVVERGWTRLAVRRNDHRYLVYVREIVRGLRGWEGRELYEAGAAGPRGGRPRGAKTATAEARQVAVEYALDDAAREDRVYEAPLTAPRAGVRRWE